MLSALNKPPPEEFNMDVELTLTAAVPMQGSVEPSFTSSWSLNPSYLFF
jgi:hypothetical protein